MNNTLFISTALAPYTTKITFPKKTTIIEEGVICKDIYFVESGCVRSWFNQDGKDVSFQFFMGESIISACDSFLFNEPSPFAYETLLPTTIHSMPASLFRQQIESSPELKDAVFKLICERFRHYQQLFLSRIKDTPQQRYYELTQHHPEIIKMIPQHYIASYLGITSVSLSRIRCRKSY